MPSRPRRRRGRPSAQRALVLAVAPLFVAAGDASAGVFIRNIQPAGTNVTTAGAVPAAAGAPVVSLPLQSPPINGFQPFVVYGLTDEAENDFISLPSPGPPLAGADPVPNPPRYLIATFDTGSTAHIFSAADAVAINLFANGLEGAHSIPVQGASGTEDLDVSDALGVYMTGLANATPGANGPSIPVSSLKGMYNTSVLTAWGDSVIPSLIGVPMTAYHQVRMYNSQTQRLTVNGQTYQGPQVELVELGTPIDNSYVRTDLTPVYPGGANQVPIYEPDFFGEEDWNNNPFNPTVYNGLIAAVNVTHTAGTLGEREFLFDTGAQVTVLSTAVANGIGIATGGSNPTPVDFTVEVLGVGGIKIVNGYYIQKLSLVASGGLTEWTNVPVLVDNLPDVRDGVGFIPGILGMNLFTDRDLVVNSDLSDPYFAFSEVPFQPRWTGTAGGNWGDNTKWMLGVPWQPGAPANFTASTPAPQTINVEADYTLGSITFDNAGRYTLSGPGTLRIEQIIGSAAVQATSGSHTVAAPLELASSTALIVPLAGSTLTFSNDVTATAPTVNVTKTGQGTVEMKNLRGAGTLDVQAGTVRMIQGAGGAAGTSTVEDVAVAASAQLDLKNNNLIVRDGSFTAVQGLVDAGFITTTTSDAGIGLTALGVATAGQVGYAGGTFVGVSVDADDILVMYTYKGDANLDGFISGDDYSAMDFAAGIPGASGWVNGDFNYDGMISGDDYSTIDFNLVAQGAPFPTAGSASSAVAAVPEPSAAAVIAAGAASLLIRRRRRPGHR